MDTSRRKWVEGTSRLPSPSQPANYRITVRGPAGNNWSGWLGATAIDDGDSTTTITVVVDQAALRGLLCRLWDLNATLIEVAVNPPGSRSEGGRQDG